MGCGISTSIDPIVPDSLQLPLPLSLSLTPKKIKKVHTQDYMKDIEITLSIDQTCDPFNNISDDEMEDICMKQFEQSTEQNSLME